MNTVRILIADDHQLVRDGLVAILNRAHPEWEIASAANGIEALNRANTFRPHVAILDLSMPEMDGLEVVAQLRNSVRNIRILLLTVYACEPVTRRALRAGVNAVLDKAESPRMLVGAVENLLEAAEFPVSDVVLRPASELTEKARVPAQYLLSSREVEILGLLALGKANKEIAADLDISVRTVESHRARIMERLSVQSLGEMMAVAVNDGIV